MRSVKTLMRNSVVLGLGLLFALALVGCVGTSEPRPDIEATVGKPVEGDGVSIRCATGHGTERIASEMGRADSAASLSREAVSGYPSEAGSRFASPGASWRD